MASSLVSHSSSVFCSSLPVFFGRRGFLGDDYKRRLGLPSSFSFSRHVSSLSLLANHHVDSGLNPNLRSSHVNSLNGYGLNYYRPHDHTSLGRDTFRLRALLQSAGWSSSSAASSSSSANGMVDGIVTSGVSGALSMNGNTNGMVATQAATYGGGTSAPLVGGKTIEAASVSLAAVTGGAVTAAPAMPLLPPELPDRYASYATSASLGRFNAQLATDEHNVVMGTNANATPATAAAAHHSPVHMVNDISTEASLHSNPPTSMKTPEENEVVPAGFDTLAVCRSFEKSGMTSDEAERLTRQILDIIIAADRRTRTTVASKGELESLRTENRISMEAWKAEIKGETKSLFGTLSRNQEYVTNEHDKIRSELKHETEKLMASQRLDLNLEKGRMRDEMHTMEDRLHTAEAKLEKSLAEVKTQLEMAKNDIIRFALGTSLSFVAVGLGILRFLS
mmetsp:Transcript_1992/g.5344  ORF Transcript_1992/g.5344 Transcript_1992/m.5344 type:complete len:450 (+) Transcript_1992:192-1541(+)